MSSLPGAPLFPQYNGPYSFKTIYGPEVAPQEFPECDLIFYDNRKIEVIDDGVTELLHIQMPSVTVLPEVPKCFSPSEQYRRDFFEAFKMEKDPPSEQIIYRVFLSTDGAKITRMFLEKDLRCARNEVVLFVEVKNEEDVFSGSALYMKMGEYAAKYLKANGRVSELAQNIAQHGIEKEQIVELIASLNREETFTDTLLNILAAVVKGAAFIINLPLKAASRILGWGIERIETLLIDESFWNPDHPKYNRSVEIAIKRSAEGLRKLVSTAEANLARVEQRLGRYDLAELKNTVSAINHLRAQLNSLPTIVDVAEKIITEGVHFFLGLLCGLWNAIVELVNRVAGVYKTAN